MRLTEQEFLDRMAKKKVQRVIIPVRLPTWNALLVMNPWQRKKVRDVIHNLVANVVSTSIIEGDDLRTQTVFQLKRPLTDFAMSDYLKTITPKSLQIYRSRKKYQTLRKQ